MMTSTSMSEPRWADDRSATEPPHLGPPLLNSTRANKLRAAISDWIAFRFRARTVTIQQDRPAPRALKSPAPRSPAVNSYDRPDRQYDSFTYNLVQRLGEIDTAVELHVARNDQVTLEEIEAKNPTPPHNLARSVHAARGRHLERRGRAFRTENSLARRLSRSPVHRPHLRRERGPADRIMHGKTSMIHHDGKGVYRGLSNPFEATATIAS